MSVVTALQKHAKRFRVIDPDKLLLKKYHLTPLQRVLMIAWASALSQIAIFVGSAMYFLTTQVSYEAGYGSSTVTLLSLKDPWDRLPIYVENLFHASWFGSSQAAPAWWVVARHDFRHVLIGFLAALLIGAITVGLKKRKRASTAHMVLSVPLALMVAGLVSAVMIVVFDKVFPFVNKLGFVTNNPYLSDFLGKDTVQLTVVGVIAGIAAKRVLARTFDTIQLLSLERNMAQDPNQKWWWRFVYPPNYRRRFDYLVASGHESGLHSKWLGMVLAFGGPVLVGLLAFGLWLDLLGPAAHAH